MKTFEMVRNSDESKVSGTGSVLAGVIFRSGKVVVSWHSKSDINSLGIYDNYYEFYFIHVASHPTNETQIIFDEESPKPLKRERNKACRHCKKPFNEHPKDLQWHENGLRRSCIGNLIELID